MNPNRITTHIIRLAQSTPLPCSIYNPDTNAPCGKPATAAYANELSNLPPAGRWLVQPVCSECATAAAKVYEDNS